MLGKRIKIIIATVAVMVLASVVAFAVKYPYAKIEFSGIRMVTNPIDHSTQGFVDITLKNVNARGISFCLEYDKDYLILSDVETNKEVKNDDTAGSSFNPYASFDISHAFFDQYTENFPSDPQVFNNDILQSDNIGPNVPIIGVADPETGHILMNFLPVDGSDKVTSKIGIDQWGKDDEPVILAEDEDLLIGSISFRIDHPDEFVKLSKDKLKNVIKVVKFSKMLNAGDVSDDEGGIHILYIDDDKDIKPWSREDQHVEYNIKIDADLADVQPQIDEATVTSYEIYSNNSLTDLVDFLNERMALVNLKYTDTTIVPAVFKWDATADGFKVTDDSDNPVTWDPKGGTYIVTQKYNDKFSITVKVNVTPISLVGFSTDNENITYLYSDDEENNFPETFEQLELPKKAYPIFSDYVPNYGYSSEDIDWYSLSDNPTSGITTLPEGFNPDKKEDFVPADKSYTFICHLAGSNAEIEADYPWLTVGSKLPEFSVNRNIVVNNVDMPKELVVIEKSVDNDGNLVIIVKNKDGTPIPEKTTFRLKLPDGDIIDISSLVSLDHANVDIITDAANEDYGKAIIKITPNSKDNPSEKKLEAFINLGNRAGSFAIASTEYNDDDTPKDEGPFTSFEISPRLNIYTYPLGVSKYEFDFSGSISGVFPVKAGSLPATTITLPVTTEPPATETSTVLENKVLTTYNGYDGTEPGELRTITVDSWTVDEVIKGSVSTPGSIIRVKGRLKDTSYTNYGEVKNPDNVEVYLTYYTVDGDNPDKIDTISDFNYDTQCVGYDHDDLQTEAFTIKNTGVETISGLNVDIALASATLYNPETDTYDITDTREAFVLTKVPVTMLGDGEEETFEITTKPGLPIGKYKSVVTVYSNNIPLQSFNITFEVIKDPVYKIKLTIDDKQKDFGTAKTQIDGIETYTAVGGKLVMIIAEPDTEADCEFVEWEVISGDIELADPKSKTTTFTMPKNDVEIKAKFRETLGAKLRAPELMIQDSDKSPPFANTGYGFYDEDWQKVVYDPATREYYVAVPYDTDDIKLWFTLRDEIDNDDTTKKLTYSVVGGISGESDPGETPEPTTEPTETSEPETTGAPASETPAPSEPSGTEITINDISSGEYKGYHYSDDISLQVSPAENILKLSLTASDEVEGETTRTYTIHIFKKLRKSDMITFAYGNSPFGLIMRDENYTDDPDKQQSMKQAFTDNHFTFVGVDNTPQGAIEGTHYPQNAWSSQSYDLNESALFVIANESFVDPGYSSIVNSISGEITSEVTKKITVQRLVETVDEDKDGSPIDFVRINAETISLPVSGTIPALAVDNSQIRRIRPDIYSIEYSFTDFDGTTMTLSKPIIILPPLGDINVNYEANITDAKRVVNRFNREIADNTNIPVASGIPSYSSGGLLFRYRVCDANKDGVVNAVDANNIEHNNLSPFYKNLQ